MIGTSYPLIFHEMLNICCIDVHEQYVIKGENAVKAIIQHVIFIEFSLVIMVNAISLLFRPRYLDCVWHGTYIHCNGEIQNTQLTCQITFHKTV